MSVSIIVYFSLLFLENTKDLISQLEKTNWNFLNIYFTTPILCLLRLIYLESHHVLS